MGVNCVEHSDLPSINKSHRSDTNVWCEGQIKQRKAQRQSGERQRKEGCSRGTNQTEERGEAKKRRANLQELKKQKTNKPEQKTKRCKQSEKKKAKKKDMRRDE